MNCATTLCSGPCCIILYCALLCCAVLCCALSPLHLQSHYVSHITPHILNSFTLLYFALLCSALISLVYDILCAGDSSVLLKTLDGGATWVSLSANMPKTLSNSNFAYHAISALSDKGDRCQLRRCSPALLLIFTYKNTH